MFHSEQERDGEKERDRDREMRERERELQPTRKSFQNNTNKSCNIENHLLDRKMFLLCF